MKEIKIPSDSFELISSIMSANLDKVNTFSLKELKALDRLLDGKATKKDYETLKERSWKEKMSINITRLKNTLRTL